MANKEHLKIIKQGVKVWNRWRKNHFDIAPDLSGANLAEVYLTERVPMKADPDTVILSGINLRGANLYGADMNRATLIEANLSRADLGETDFTAAQLMLANFQHANLTDSNFSRSLIGGTKFEGIDLSKIRGLDTVRHFSPSSIDIDTLYKSRGQIPEVFLRNCGVPDEFIAYLPSLIGAQQAIQFYSCFISYSSKDEEFARRLCSRMRDTHLRVWFAPEDMVAGGKLREQIDCAIQSHDRLLIVLSENSLRSKWVETEIRRARGTELMEKRRKLFPIRLVSYERLQEWECFDSDMGEDLAREVREYYIPDFSNWKDHDSFETEFAKLLKSLRAAEGEGKEP